MYMHKICLSVLVLSNGTLGTLVIVDNVHVTESQCAIIDNFGFSKYYQSKEPEMGNFKALVVCVS